MGRLNRKKGKNMKAVKRMNKYIIVALNKYSCEVARYESMANDVYCAIEKAESYFKKNELVYDRVISL